MIFTSYLLTDTILTGNYMEMFTYDENCELVQMAHNSVISLYSVVFPACIMVSTSRAETPVSGMTYCMDYFLFTTDNAHRQL